MTVNRRHISVLSRIDVDDPLFSERLYSEITRLTHCF